MHDYIRAWREFRLASVPLILASDEALLEQSSRAFVYYDRSSFESAKLQKSYRASHFHLGLLPQPFHGRLETAKVYVLALNPGFRDSDYEEVIDRPEFRAALIGSYEGIAPMLFLDDR